jgi:CRP-like cAMP-binding protein
LSESELATVISSARHRRFHASSVAINEEDPAARLYLLTSGHGRHFLITNEGQRILLNWLTAGQIFGGATILSVETQYLANTELLEESCAFVWDRQNIRAMAMKFPVLLENTLSIAVTENIAWSTAAHISLSTQDASGRVAHLLVSVASAIGRVTHGGVVVPVLNDDLAAGANVTSFTVSRCLKDWERKGILSKRRGAILLRKPELLLAG